MEEKSIEAGRDIISLTMPEMHSLWDEAKEKVG
jgi:uncharacterized protein YabN with tetrapyrrole methylase and pyrophosphatase domain